MIPVETPLGVLETGIVVGDAVFPGEPRAPAPGAPMSFHDDTVLAVCLLDHARPALPTGMEVEGCIGVRWTVVARKDTGIVSVGWRWRPGWAWNEGGADAGQYFDAMTYSGEEYVATIATRDGGWLAQAAEEGEHVPRRFEPKVESEFYMLPWVNYRAEGFSISVPPLEARERVTLFLSAAWAARRTGDDARAATMLAADLALLA